NIFLLLFVLCDYLLPGKVMPIKELEHFYAVTVKVNNTIKPTFVDRKILLLTNGESYRLSTIPEGDYEKGQKVQVVKSIFKGNITNVIIHGNTIETKHVGILSNNILVICVIFSLVTSLLNLVYHNRFLLIGLVSATMFTLIFGIGYLLT